MDAIKIGNLTKTYGNLIAVDNLSLTVKHGEIFSLLGVNGAGKTTTIKMLSCLTKPASGDAYLYDKSIVKNPSAVKSIIGVSPQETSVAAGLTVEENLSLMCGIYGLKGEEKRKRLDEITSNLNLKDILKKKAGKLSGGWQRRLSIAMALISHPSILFLDEPTLGLDVIARSDLWDLIKSLKGTITIVLTTHYMQEAEALSDRIGIMKDGKLLVCDNSDEIKRMAGTDNFEEAFVRIVKGAKI